MCFCFVFRTILIETSEKLYHSRRDISNNINMPAVASVPKELYLCTSLKDLNKKTEIKPEKTSTKRCIFSLIWDQLFKIQVLVAYSK